MKNRFLLGAGAALALAFGCAEANAQATYAPPPTYTLWGWTYPYAFYVGPEGGWTSLSNQKTTATTLPFRVDTLGAAPPGPFFTNFGGTARYDSGFNVGARAGVQWGPLRVEEEYSYRHNGLSGFSLNLPVSIASGNRNTNSLMTNFIYDFGTLLFGWPITPHLGFGIGAVNNVDSATVNPFTVAQPFQVNFPGNVGPLRVPAGTTFGGTFLKGNTWNFGYQAIAGIRYDINPLLAFDLDYRYLASTEPTFTNRGVFPLPGNAPNAGFPGGTTRYKSGYNTQNLVASLTMKFGAPPAPPPPLPPAAAPPPPQVYLVFFDWDKYNITPEGMQIIQLAANQYRAGGSVRLHVTGYTDTSGSAGYNQRLSERRANAVAAALARLGVARNDMVVSGRGMNDLRVPTPPGVREPQNRRVEIVFGP